MEEMELKYINIKEFEKDAYSYYLKIFPEEERKSLKLIKTSYEKNYAKIIKILYKKEFVGFMIINRIKDKGYIILDYLAILPQYQNNGFGTQALNLLMGQEKENSGIFIEIEKVGLGKSEAENIARERRRNFYEKLGFKKLNCDFLLFDVIYTPYLFSNIQNEEDIIIKEIFDIYEAIAGKRRIQNNCKILKNL